MRRRRRKWCRRWCYVRTYLRTMLRARRRVPASRQLCTTTTTTVTTTTAITTVQNAKASLRPNQPTAKKHSRVYALGHVYVYRGGRGWRVYTYVRTYSRPIRAWTSAGDSMRTPPSYIQQYLSDMLGILYSIFAVFETAPYLAAHPLSLSLYIYISTCFYIYI